jgi:hypothetical protein
MPDRSDRKSLARSAYEAYEANDRDLIDSLLAEDFAVYSPRIPVSIVRRTSSAAGPTPSVSRSSGSSRTGTRSS